MLQLFLHTVVNLYSDNRNEWKYLLNENQSDVHGYLCSIDLKLIFAMFAPQIYVSKKWGFTKWNRDEFEVMRANGRLQPDGVTVKYLPEHGPLSAWRKVQAELAGL